MKKKNIIGETITNKDNRIMTICNYKNCHDLDVVFEDGVVVRHRDIREFRRGGIKHPTDKDYKTKYLGLENVNKQSKKMKIVEYFSFNNITVEFEDKEIVKRAEVRHFLEGSIRHPSDKKTNLPKKRIGEKRLSNKGLLMEIIAYRSSSDLDILFENGEIKEHVAYKEFKNGSILPSRYYNSNQVSLNEVAIYYYLKNLNFHKYRRGENEKLANFSFDLFNPEFNIAIEYDGYPWHKDYKNDLVKSNFCLDNQILLIRIREPRLPDITDGSSINFYLNTSSHLSRNLHSVLNSVIEMLCKLTAQNVTIDVDFKRDKNEIYDLYYELSFNYYKKNRIGQEKVNSKGRTMKIVDYRAYADIDVQFEDGIILSGYCFDSFKKGEILHPDDQVTKEKMEGLETLNRHGDKMKILVYNNAFDIIVQFKDGAIRKEQSVTNFKNGSIVHPSELAIKENRIGETQLNNQGKLMRIIDYQGHNNVTIQFEDGVIREKCFYNNFKKGGILHPDDVFDPKNRVGEVSYNKKGLKMTIIEYKNYDQIVVKFEDGSIKKCRYQHFKRGSVSHP